MADAMSNEARRYIEDIEQGHRVTSDEQIKRGQAAIRLLREHQWSLVIITEQPREADGRPPGVVTMLFCIAGCGNTEEQGHAEDCKLAAIIKEDGVAHG